MTVSFKNSIEKDNNTIMVIDAMNLAFRYKHKGVDEFVNDYMLTVDSLARSYKAGKVIITCDQGSSKYRKNLYPEYKSARKEKFESQTAEEAEAFERFFAELMRVMDTYVEEGRYPVLKFQGCEADDIAAYIVSKYKNSKTIWLMSSDKDWDLLVDVSVNRFSYVTRKETTIDTWYDHYEYEPEHHILVKCLTGDSGDSIPGVQGIGPKKAAALANTYDTVENLINSMPIDSKYAHIKKLNEFGKDKILLNEQLMDLVKYCKEALGPEITNTIDQTLLEYIGE